MAVIDGRPTLQLHVTISLSEQEAGALDALIGYGIEPFLKVFYEHMGKAYLHPYEPGLRSLFESRGQLKHLIDQAAKARGVFAGTHIAVRKQDEV